MNGLTHKTLVSSRSMLDKSKAAPLPPPPEHTLSSQRCCKTAPPQRQSCKATQAAPPQTLLQNYGKTATPNQ